MDIHNEFLLGWLKANEDNNNIKKFLKQLDKSVKEDYSFECKGKTHIIKGSKNYYEYLNNNIGDDANFTLEELELIKKGKLIVEYHKKDGKLHFFKYE